MTGAAYIVFFYSLFALLATIVNIGSQAAFIAIYSQSYAIEISILVGTALGLLVKYILDKTYIFRFKTENLSHDGQLFFLYTVMGIATTILFWGVEYLFYVIFKTDIMRYVGGCIGLAIGYMAKYQLDKRFVFMKATTQSTYYE